MRIILFENDPFLRKKVCDLVEKTFNRSIDKATDQWHELSESYCDETTLYFLDIMVRDEAQGIAFAQWILQRSKKHLIVFLTNYMDKILGQTYLQVNSFNVIYKQSPHVMKQIVDTIDLAQAHVDQQTLLIQTQTAINIVHFDEIIFIQKVKTRNKMLVHTLTANYIYFDSLQHIFPKLDQRFIYINRSCIVNRKKIVSIDKLQKRIILEDGSICDYTISFALKGGLL